MSAYSSQILGNRLPPAPRPARDEQPSEKGDSSVRPDYFVKMGDVSPSSLACPKCRNVEGRVMPFSEQLRVHRWFFRCAVCGHVWTIDKKLQTPGRSQPKKQQPRPHLPT